MTVAVNTVMGHSCSRHLSDGQAQARMKELLHSDFERNAFGNYMQSQQHTYYPVFDLTLMLQRCLRHRNDQKGLALRDDLVHTLVQDQHIWKVDTLFGDP